MVKENIRIFAVSINKQESESDLSYSQESESEVQTTDSPALIQTKALCFAKIDFCFEMHVTFAVPITNHKILFSKERRLSKMFLQFRYTALQVRLCNFFMLPGFVSGTIIF